MRHPFRILLACTAASILACSCAAAGDRAPPAEIERAIAAPGRTPANIARDAYRHPAETLAFFGVSPTDRVVELWPGGGWYTEILAPLLKDQGKLIVAAPMPNGLSGITKLVNAHPGDYDAVGMAAFPAKDGEAGVPAESIDVVLTFRNVHNWRFGGVDQAQSNFDAIFAMLKPGGTLGIVDHRLPEARDSAAEEKSGYMKESSIIGFAEKAGFKLAARSEINANAKDTADYPDGVWTLPPTYTLKDQDRAKYAAIGESDRMTLKFVKPK